MGIPFEGKATRYVFSRAHSKSHSLPIAPASRSPSQVPFYLFFFFWGGGSPTKIDYRKGKKTLVPTYSNLSNLEDLGKLFLGVAEAGEKVLWKWAPASEEHRNSRKAVVFGR